MLIGKYAIKVRITKELSRKHQVFPESSIKPYHKTGKDRFRSRNKSNTPQDIVRVEVSPGLVKIIIKARKIRFNGKDYRKYLVRLKNQTADKDKWLAEDAIPDGELHLTILSAFKRA
ncbi:hypothetical protein O181_008542 [Austropuccinia psidii MF-1]|uniref:Uncharacterized protein n=1 Tax=Austropuccinia psidii MF-1 TaxID=1389203 RepID=A0A9Q3BPY6_9BASI|nr:hypothetical protein [Austropuccinia psidii MF-1]